MSNGLTGNFYVGKFGLLGLRGAELLDNPRMVSHFSEIDSLFGVLLQELADQIAGKWRYKVWVLDVDVADAAACGSL